MRKYTNPGEYIYSGDKLRRFLQYRGISYKMASAELGIDRNTVGKAVRGGNMNIDILLHICNHYGMKITDFFKVIKYDENGNPVSETDASLKTEFLSTTTQMQAKIEELQEICNAQRQSLSELFEENTLL